MGEWHHISEFVLIESSSMRSIPLTYYQETEFTSSSLGFSDFHISIYAFVGFFKLSYFTSEFRIPTFTNRRPISTYHKSFKFAIIRLVAHQRTRASLWFKIPKGGVVNIRLQVQTNPVYCFSPFRKSWHLNSWKISALSHDKGVVNLPHIFSFPYLFFMPRDHI